MKRLEKQTSKSNSPQCGLPQLSVIYMETILSCIHQIK